VGLQSRIASANELATTDTELKLIAAAAAILLFGAKLAAVAEDESYKTVDGLAVISASSPPRS
jgi:hypothetical protein